MPDFIGFLNYYKRAISLETIRIYSSQTVLGPLILTFPSKLNIQAKKALLIWTIALAWHVEPVIVIILRSSPNLLAIASATLLSNSRDSSTNLPTLISDESFMHLSKRNPFGSGIMFLLTISGTSHIQSILKANSCMFFSEYAINDAVIAMLYSSELWGVNTTMPVTVSSASGKAAVPIIKEYYGLEPSDNEGFNREYRGLKTVKKGLVPNFDGFGFLVLDNA